MIPSIKRKGPLSSDITIVIPCYNHAQYLPDCLNSLLRQTVLDFKVILVNDGSTDKSETIAQAYIDKFQDGQFRILSIDNAGLSNARNRAIEATETALILTLDSDDYLADHAIEQYVATFNELEGDGIVFSYIQNFGSDDGLIRISDQLSSLDLYFLGGNLPSAALFSKQLWQQLGGYRPSFVWGGEDWDFWIRAFALKYPYSVCRKPLFFYRQFQSNGLSNRLMQNIDVVRAQSRILNPNFYDSEVTQRAENIIANADDFQKRLKDQYQRTPSKDIKVLMDCQAIEKSPFNLSMASSNTTVHMALQGDSPCQSDNQAFMKAHRNQFGSFSVQTVSMGESLPNTDSSDYVLFVPDRFVLSVSFLKKVQEDVKKGGGLLCYKGDVSHWTGHPFLEWQLALHAQYDSDVFPQLCYYQPLVFLVHRDILSVYPSIMGYYRRESLSLLIECQTAIQSVDAVKVLNGDGLLLNPCYDMASFYQDVYQQAVTDAMMWPRYFDCLFHVISPHFLSFLTPPNAATLKPVLGALLSKHAQLEQSKSDDIRLIEGVVYDAAAHVKLDNDQIGLSERKIIYNALRLYAQSVAYEDAKQGDRKDSFSLD